MTSNGRWIKISWCTVWGEASVRRTIVPVKRSAFIVLETYISERASNRATPSDKSDKDSGGDPDKLANVPTNSTIAMARVELSSVMMTTDGSFSALRTIRKCVCYSYLRRGKIQTFWLANRYLVWTIIRREDSRKPQTTE